LTSILRRLIVSVLDTAKEVVSLVQKIDNIELYREILALQAEIQKLYGENLALNEQITTLKEKLRIKGALRFHDSNYFLVQDNGTEDGPFCSTCQDVDGKLVRLARSGYDEDICSYCTFYRNRQRS
jgi:hypothetical protein